jgi:hypothetical protein
MTLTGYNPQIDHFIPLPVLAAILGTAGWRTLFITS